MTQRKSKIIFTNESVAYLIRFLMYNLIGALLPLMISWVIRYLSALQPPAGAYAPEILFFGIMISATALGDITDESRKFESDYFFQFVKGILLFGCIGVGAIFGVYQYDAIAGGVNSNLRTNITSFSIIVSLSLFLTSFLAEILIARNKGTLT